jgi:transcriptional regulator with XRE-family HTH domain
MSHGETDRRSSGLGQRLKLRRLAKGWSLDDLATEIGGLVTKQALHKYEKEQARPTPRVLQKLAQVLDVPASHLASEVETTVNFVAYRKMSGLSMRDQGHIKARVEVGTLERVRLQKLLGQELDLPELCR